eukprot:6334104-Alexandrium_andersonii.AAC.1
MAGRTTGRVMPRECVVGPGTPGRRAHRAADRVDGPPGGTEVPKTKTRRVEVRFWSTLRGGWPW